MAPTAVPHTFDTLLEFDSQFGAQREQHLEDL
jgi:hypothetical protein